LREAIRGWLRDPNTFPALAVLVDTHLGHPAPRVRLARPEGHIVRQVWIGDCPPSTLLRALAKDVAALACDVERRAVRRCAADDCEAWFFASGRASERAWCSQERCGHRHRNATYEKTSRRHRFR
jgi:predicted RNA-binding Zn ribbon-like protein